VKIEVLFLGKTKETYLADGIADYADRLSRYAPLAIKEIKDRGGKNNHPSSVILRQEGEALLKARTKNHLLVALDRKGIALSSKKIADMIEDWQGRGIKGVSFVIGGPLGLSSEVVAQADYVVSFSKMTFTHEMARLILLEQLYRAFTINAGTGYHK
jgi:23S rRNA (pseudouridine1915-N3)-methyltransferase